jgi:6-phosphogluconolactonase/glucosamine-6-phosphate isomerase/deaminase
MTELFQYKSAEDAISAAADYLAKQLEDSQGNVLFLLSGGSSLNPVRVAFKKLSDDTVRRLYIAQIDERLAENGEPTNWSQIEKALGGKLSRTAGQLAMLFDGGEPDDDAIAYEMELRSLLETADEVIGIYGVGEDGRLGGILPSKEPENFTQFLDGRLTVAYQAADFTRITTTAALLSRLNEAIVFACGPNKVKTIERINKDLPANRHPVQLLKDAKRASLFVAEELA